MAKNNGQTNREQVESNALTLTFGKEKAQPLIPFEGMTDKGSVTYASIRKWLKESQPELKGDALTTKVNEMMNNCNAVATAAVLQAVQSGFHVRRFTGRELKRGGHSISIGLTDAPDRASKPRKSIEDYSAEELEALAAKKREASEKIADATTIEA